MVSHTVQFFFLFCPQQVFCSPEPPAKTSTPEDFIRMTKGITMATAKAVAAGNSCRQEDVIATANLSRRAIADMLRACKVETLIVRPKSEVVWQLWGRTRVGRDRRALGGLEPFGILKLTVWDRKRLTTQKWPLTCGFEPCTMAGSVPTATWSCWTTCCW